MFKRVHGSLVAVKGEEVDINQVAHQGGLYNLIVNCKNNLTLQSQKHLVAKGPLEWKISTSEESFPPQAVKTALHFMDNSALPKLSSQILPNLLYVQYLLAPHFTSSMLFLHRCFRKLKGFAYKLDRIDISKRFVNLFRVIREQVGSLLHIQFLLCSAMRANKAYNFNKLNFLGNRHLCLQDGEQKIKEAKESLKQFVTVTVDASAISLCTSITDGLTCK